MSEKAESKTLVKLTPAVAGPNTREVTALIKTPE